MRKTGTTASGCNIRIGSLNAFFRWAGHPPIRKLKEEEVISPAFSPARRLEPCPLQATPRDKRIFTLMLMLLDTGVRINDALSLQKTDPHSLVFRGKRFL